MSDERFAFTGDLCACSCGCDRPLTEANTMQQDITDDPDMPWEKSDPDGRRVMLIICVNCYTGEHRKPEPRRPPR